MERKLPKVLSKDIICPIFIAWRRGHLERSHGEHKLRCLKLLSFFFFLHISPFESVKESVVMIEEALLYMGEHGIRGLDFLAGV